jgi:hypothetical protein
MTHTLHRTTIARVRSLQAQALEQLEQEYEPRHPRPTCAACRSHRPTIDGYCVPHMTQRTEINLYTVSADDVLTSGL